MISFLIYCNFDHIIKIDNYRYRLILLSNMTNIAFPPDLYDTIYPKRTERSLGALDRTTSVSISLSSGVTSSCTSRLTMLTARLVIGDTKLSSSGVSPIISTWGL